MAPRKRKTTSEPVPTAPVVISGCTNPLAKNYNASATLEDGSCYFAEPNAFIVNGFYPDHDNIVAQNVSIGYGSDISSRKRVLNGTPSSYMTYANQRDIPLVLYPYAGIENYVSSAQANYPTVLLVMPLGSNSKVELTNLSGIPVVVPIGGSTDNLQCTTGYGLGLEFWDNHGASSNANGLVAGKLLYIKDTLKCSWWEARYRARKTAYRTALTHPNNEEWNKFNGYGRIDVTAAIAFTGIIPVDPYKI